MSTKESILGRIREAIADLKPADRQLPDPPKVWSNENLSIAEQVERFQTHLEAVAGEVVRCKSILDASNRVAELLDKLEARSIAVLDRPLAREVADKLQGKEIVSAPANPADASPESMSKLDAGLVSPEYLLTDTGSCLFAAPTAFDRLATYIVPVAVIVAKTSMLRENLQSAWSELKSRLQSAQTGEFVIVTGPSRTADIEKILILGVHGPKRVVVFLIEDEA